MANNIVYHIYSVRALLKPPIPSLSVTPLSLLRLHIVDLKSVVKISATIRNQMYRMIRILEMQPESWYTFERVINLVCGFERMKRERIERVYCWPGVVCVMTRASFITRRANKIIPSITTSIVLVDLRTLCDSIYEFCV